MLMMLVDSMAKYAGVQLKRPEVPENAKEMMQQIPNLVKERIETLEARIRKGPSDQEQAEIQSLDAEIKSLQEKKKELSSIERQAWKKSWPAELEVEKIINALREDMYKAKGKEYNEGEVSTKDQEIEDVLERKKQELYEEKVAPPQKKGDEAYEQSKALGKEIEKCEKRKNELLLVHEQKQLQTLQDIKPTAEGEEPVASQRNDKRFLEDLYYHFDVFALHMPSCAAFSERYDCSFVPIQEKTITNLPPRQLKASHASHPHRHLKNRKRII
jgi:hypothetical protein